jgi:hypothetical protein
MKRWFTGHVKCRDSLLFSTPYSLRDEAFGAFYLNVRVDVPFILFL